MRLKGLIYIPFLLLASLAYSETPHLEALGGVFVPSMQGTEGMGGNPAAISGNRNHQIFVGATKYWLGLSEENIFGSRIAYVPPSAKFGSIGLEFRQFGTGVHDRFDIGAAYAYSIGVRGTKELSLGIYGRWIRNQYHIDEFYRFDDDPLFNRYGSSADGFGLDAGVLFRSSSFDLGFAGRNLVKPSLALSGGTEEGETESTELVAGAAYSAFEWLVPSGQISWTEDGGIDGACGVEFLVFDGILSLRTGYRPGGATFGIGLTGRTRFPLAFDYALVYPDGSLSKAGLTTHSVGITANIAPRVRPPKKKPSPKTITGLPDIMAAADPVAPELPIAEVGVKRSYRAIIKNVGEIPIDQATTSIFFMGEDSFMVGDLISVPLLEPGEDFPIEWKWASPTSGRYSFLVSADDDGSRFPLYSGSISEISIANNRIEIPFYVIGPIEADIVPEFCNFDIEELTYIAEEEPLVPVVFFENGKTTVAERFVPVLDAIVQRTHENPDIKVVLSGYIDPSSDPETWETDSLNVRRAIEVERMALEIGADIDAVEVAHDGYDPTVSRISISARHESMEDMIWAQQENRRVEMSTAIDGLDGEIFTFEFPDGPTLPVALRDSVIGLGPKIAGYIDRNPELSLIFEGNARSEREWSEIYEILDGLRARLLAGADLDVDYGRFPVLVDVNKDSPGAIRIYGSGEGLLYRPKEAALAAKDFEIPEDKKRNKILIDISEGIVESYSVHIVDQDSVEIIELASGEGLPPKEVFWDWRDENGNLVDPRKVYRVRLSATDPVGETSNNYSPEIRIRVAGIERRMESTIIVQFAFDEVNSTSKYLESRIESMAKKVESLGGKSGFRLNIKIIGHTDPIGTDRRNKILSEQRAEQEETAIRRYLRRFVGVDTDSELERWLSEHNITLVRQGMADKDPYEVERYRAGRFERILLGNNAFPEGRAANRRVIIQIEEITEH